MNVIRIGTRKSPLAMAQAGEVRARLLELRPQLQVELVSMSTSGDRLTDMPLTDVGGKGLFTKELEEGLFSGTIDIAVHSMKDMQTVLPGGLVIACMLPREDPRDMLVGKNMTSIAAIPHGASVGTSSLRRAAQLLALRPDLKIVPLRGNVQTRLAKLEAGNVCATMLAKAGLNRLALSAIPGAVLSLEEFLPAVAQGAIGIECREADVEIRALLAPLSHADTEIAVRCERAFLRVMDGSCRTPIAGHATIKGELHFTGMITSPDGSSQHSVTMAGDVSNPESLGEKAGKALLAKTGK